MKRIAIIILVITALLVGWLYFVKCYLGIRKHHAVPEALIQEAQIPGMKNMRIVVDPLKIKHSTFVEEVFKSGLTKAKFLNPEINILAISGGGANGAHRARVPCRPPEAG